MLSDVIALNDFPHIALPDLSDIALSLLRAGGCRSG